MSKRSSEEILKTFDKDLEWTDPSDDRPQKHTLEWKGHTWVFYVKAMDYLQEVGYQRRLSQMTGGLDPRTFDDYSKMRAIAIVRTCFDNIPKWLSWLLLNDDEVAIAIANKVEDRTHSFRAEHGAARDAETGEARFSISA